MRRAFDSMSTASAAPPRVPPAWAEPLSLRDPGLVRTAFALRAVVAIALAGLGGVLIAALFAEAPAARAPLIAGLAAYLALSTVNDSSVAEQRASTIALLVPLYGALLVGAVIAGLPNWALNAALVALAVPAFMLRRRGPRYPGLGMTVLTGVVFGALLRLSITGWLWLACATAAGVGAAYLLRFVILPRDIAHHATRIVDAFLSRTADVLSIVAEATGGAGGVEPALRRAIERMRAVHRVAGSEIAAYNPDAAKTYSQVQQLRLALFDVEQSAASLGLHAGAAATARVSFPDDVRAALVGAIDASRALLEAPRSTDARARAEAAVATLAQALPGHAEDVGARAWAHHAVRMTAALRALPDEVAAAGAALSQLGAVPEGGRQPHTAPPDATRRGRLHPTTVMAFRAALAGLIATGIAFAFGVERPYWATLTAILIVSNTAGQTAQRVVLQGAATLLGALVGFVAAGALVNAGLLGVLMLFACIALQLFTARTSFAWSNFWSTVVLTLLLTSLLGLHADLFVARVLDVLIGGLAGAAIAAWVLPQRSVDAFNAGVAAALRDIDALARDAVAALVGQGGGDQLEAAASALDRRLEAVAAELAALKYESGVPGDGRNRLSRHMTLLDAAGRSAARLANLAHRGPPVEPAMRALLLESQRCAASNIAAVLRWLEDGARPELCDLAAVRARAHAEGDPAQLLRLDAGPDGDRAIAAEHGLVRLNDAVCGMAEDLARSP